METIAEIVFYMMGRLKFEVIGVILWLHKPAHKKVKRARRVVVAEVKELRDLETITNDFYMPPRSYDPRKILVPWPAACFGPEGLDFVELDMLWQQIGEGKREPFTIFFKAK